MIGNPGADAPVPSCGSSCGAVMRSFDQLPRPLRDFFNDEARVQWCMCLGLRYARAVGEAATLDHSRELEAYATRAIDRLPATTVRQGC